MANRYETMLDDHFEHGFAVDWMRKDLGICLDTANETGASLRSPRWSISSTKTSRKWAAGGGTRPAFSKGCARLVGKLVQIHLHDGSENWADGPISHPLVWSVEINPAVNDHALPGHR